MHARSMSPDTLLETTREVVRSVARRYSQSIRATLIGYMRLSASRASDALCLPAAHMRDAAADFSQVTRILSLGYLEPLDHRIHMCYIYPHPLLSTTSLVRCPHSYLCSSTIRRGSRGTVPPASRPRVEAADRAACQREWHYSWGLETSLPIKTSSADGSKWCATRPGPEWCLYGCRLVGSRPALPRA